MLHRARALAGPSAVALPSGPPADRLTSLSSARRIEYGRCQEEGCSTMAVASRSLQNLARHYGKVRAVDDLSVEVPDGAFVTLLGPSGCGKSTTLHLIAGLDKPDAGKIVLGDRDITGTPPNERRMAMVFQNYALYP